MSNDRFKDDPTATYRGYRRQSLYCLFRLFEEGLPDDFIIQPEGNEDFALYDNTGKLIEISQVKDLSDNLTASKFRPTFYERIAEYCEPESEVVVNIVSFGPVGPELSAALDNSKETPSRVLDTLTKDREVQVRNGNNRTVKGVSNDVAKAILSHLTLVEVSEDDLTQALMERLKTTVSAGDPERAFENLMWWLLTSAEGQLRITRAQVIEKLNQIGHFLSHLAAFNHEWHTSIIPITVPSEAHIDHAKLTGEFFRGGRVRVGHVASNLDVRRVDLLAEIHSSFVTDNVVVVRAASGQGKTTLAYRYILDFAPADFRFEVLRPSDLQHARRMATAIAGHSVALDVPTLVYVDVRPGDTLWVEFVRELSSTPGVRVLVTIREEDWFRSRVGLDDFQFSEIALTFDELTGRQIYQLLETRLTDAKHLDFVDAWAQLGERKTLFEFVYLVTQEESLSAKIESQVASLQDAVNSQKLLPGELSLLRLVAVASAYEARVRLSPLVDACKIPEPQRTLERFNHEFLLRTSDDGTYVEGFHAIRSEIITSRLTDAALNPWHSTAAEALPLLEEADIETFLLCSFSRRPESRSNLLMGVQRFTPQSWIGVRGTGVALQWLGLAVYTSDNASLIDRVRAAFGSGWWFTLDWDLAQVREKGGFNLLESLSGLSEECAYAANAAKTVQEQQTDKNDVFVYFCDWVEKLEDLPEAPSSIPEFVALSEVMYWVGHLGVSANASKWVSGKAIDRAIERLPIQLFAEFAAAARSVSATAYQRWFESNRERLEVTLRRQAGIMSLVEDGDCLVAHYAIDLARKASVLRNLPNDVLDASAEINELSVERVEILSRCFPGFDKYGANGYGHRMSLFSTLRDDSQKKMPVENVIVPWLPEFNSLARGCAELLFRPKGWDEYVQSIHAMRDEVIIAFEALREAAQRIRAGSNSVIRNVEAWNQCEDTINGDFFLPVSAVDEWGFVSESRSSKYAASSTKRFTSVSRLEPYNKAVNEYTQTVGSFMKQALESLVLVPHLRAANTDLQRRRVLEKAKELRVNERSIHLSVMNGIDACIAINELQRCEATLFAEQSKHRREDGFLKSEVAACAETVRIWCRFAYPEQFASDRKRPKRTRKRSGFRECLKPTTNRINAALRKLAAFNIRAEIVSDSVQWDGQSALWITFDTTHPLQSLVALDKMWYSLVEAFEPDRSKIVRTKAMEFYWKRIVLVPLIEGRSVEKLAYANMNGVAGPLHQKIEEQLWRFFPEPVPPLAWEQLGLPSWERQSSWDRFDQFSAAYGELFYHVDHLADFSRCKVDLDELGESIFQDYVSHETTRMQPLYQKTLDSAARVLEELPEWTEELAKRRPNMFNCFEFLVQTRDALLPTQNFGGVVRLTIDETAEWRDRLKAGFELIGQARCLWIADSLELDGFDFEATT